MALFSGAVGEPAGMERISRHAFFYGLGLWALAHVLLVPTLSAAVFFAGFAFQAVLGSALQDRKLLGRLGEPYRRYLDGTSALPFAAILARRQSLVLQELPWTALGAGLGVAWLLREVHGHIFDYYGLWIVLAVLGGAGIATWGAERRQRQLRAQEVVHG